LQLEFGIEEYEMAEQNEYISKWFHITIDFGVPTLLSDFDFNQIDDPKEIKLILNKEYEGANKSELTAHMREYIAYGDSGELDDPDCLTEFEMLALTFPKEIVIQPFSLLIEYILKCDISGRLVDAGEDSIKSEIMHSWDFSSQMTSHDVALYNYNTWDIEEITEESFETYLTVYVND